MKTIASICFSNGDKLLLNEGTFHFALYKPREAFELFYAERFAHKSFYSINSEYFLSEEQAIEAYNIRKTNNPREISGIAPNFDEIFERERDI